LASHPKLAERRCAGEVSFGRDDFTNKASDILVRKLLTRRYGSTLYRGD
jgi:hypothetical protein